MDTTKVNTGGVYRFADLFAGAGGLSLGFVMAGYEPAMAVECDPAAGATYAQNFPHTCLHSGKIEDLTDAQLTERFGDECRVGVRPRAGLNSSKAASRITRQVS